MRLPNPTQSFLKRLSRLGVPREEAYAAVRAARFLARPDHYVAGKVLRRRYANPQANGFELPPDTGYRLFQASELQHTQAMVDASRAIVAQRVNDERAVKKKGFLENVLSDTDLVDCPAIVDFVLQPKIVDVASDYLGTLPRLCWVAVNYTPVNATTLVSQRWHRDGVDTRQVKFIVNVTDVDDGNGPFTFLPADASDDLVRRIGQSWGRVDDELVERLVPADKVVAVRGASGSGVCIDTSRCFHFGARAREAERIVLIFNFTGPYRISGEGKLPSLYEAFRDDPLRRAILSYHAP